MDIDKNITKLEGVASRHGTFLGEISAEYVIIVEKLLKILKIKLIEMENSPGYDNELYEILMHIHRDIKSNAVSQLVKDKTGSRFTLSNQELEWLNRHDVSLWLEYLIFRYQFKIYPALKKLLKKPLHILIEPTSICNLRCTMCFQSDNTFTNNKKHMGMMPFELFARVIDQARYLGCSAVTMASRGEPLLHKEVEKMLYYIHKSGFLDTKLNTNATLLTEKLCHSILSADIKELVFSVDASDKHTYESIRKKGKFENVVQNIKRFHEIREKYYPDSSTVTRISAVHVSNDQNINHLYDFWSKYVDHVTVKKAIRRWDSYNYNDQVLRSLSPCKFLWERMYIWYDGTVNPCDFDYKSLLSIGNAYDNSIEQIWNSDAYSKLRLAHLENRKKEFQPCNVCDIT